MRRSAVIHERQTLTHLPPSSVLDLKVSPHGKAAEAFDLNEAPWEWRLDNARVAIQFPAGAVVMASRAMLALFEAEDCEALETRLTRGDGPRARRLRRLAATLPIGEPRLEQVRLVVERRPVNINLRCVRVRRSRRCELALCVGSSSGRRKPWAVRARAGRRRFEAKSFAGPRRKGIAEFALPVDPRRGGPVR